MPPSPVFVVYIPCPRPLSLLCRTREDTFPTRHKLRPAGSCSIEVGTTTSVSNFSVRFARQRLLRESARPTATGLPRTLHQSRDLGSSCSHQQPVELSGASGSSYEWSACLESPYFPVIRRSQVHTTLAAPSHRGMSLWVGSKGQTNSSIVHVCCVSRGQLGCCSCRLPFSRAHRGLLHRAEWGRHCLLIPQSVSAGYPTLSTNLFWFGRRHPPGVVSKAVSDARLNS